MKGHGVYEGICESVGDNPSLYKCRALLYHPPFWKSLISAFLVYCTFLVPYALCAAPRALVFINIMGMIWDTYCRILLCFFRRHHHLLPWKLL